MADESGGTSFLGFFLGGAVVALTIIAFVIYGGQGTGPTRTVNIEAPMSSAPK